MGAHSLAVRLQGEDSSILGVACNLRNHCTPVKVASQQGDPFEAVSPPVLTSFHQVGFHIQVTLTKLQTPAAQHETLMFPRDSNDLLV